jgi:hypothetical protein
MLSLEKDCVILRKDPDEDPNWAAERPVSPGQRRKYANVAKSGAVCLVFSSLIPKHLFQVPHAVQVHRR